MEETDNYRTYKIQKEQPLLKVTLKSSKSDLQIRTLHQKAIAQSIAHSFFGRSKPYVI